MMKRFLALAVFVGLIGTAAFAGSTSATMTVEATLQTTASVTATTLSFGNWNPYEFFESINANATVTVTLTAGYPYHISLDKGSYYNLTGGGTRNLANGSNYVGYLIFQDSAGTLQWGDSDQAGTYPGGTSVAGTADGSAQIYTAYGALFPSTASKTAPAGTYLDFVTVTVNY